MRKIYFSILIISLVLVFSCPMLVQGQTKFNNVTVTAFCDAGHNALPFEWYIPKFEEAGIKVKLVTAPFGNVYEKLKSEFVFFIKITKSNSSKIYSTLLTIIVVVSRCLLRNFLV